MSFGSSEYCKRYEYVSFDLQNPITTPVNNQLQKKSGYRFLVDSSSETHPFDWYNAYFEVDFKITKMDNTGYGGADQAGVINGGFLMVNQLKVDFNGVNVLDTPGVNHAINIKNLTEFSKTYSDRVGASMFHYIDTATGAVSKKYSTLALDGNVQNIAPTDNTNYNEGFARRKTLLSASAENNIILPLNRYSFFKSFEKEIALNGKITLDVSLESDNNVIFRDNAAAAGRYIITKFVLWVPKMIFNVEGEQKYLAKYLKPHVWSYLKERIEISPSSTHRQATFKITSSIRKPRHVFIWALNDAKLNDQEQNMSCLILTI